MLYRGKRLLNSIFFLPKTRWKKPKKNYLKIFYNLIQFKNQEFTQKLPFSNIKFINRTKYVIKNKGEEKNILKKLQEINLKYI